MSNKSRFWHLLALLMAITFMPAAQAGSLLWDAITYNDIGKAKELIASGADVNQKNGLGNPIIHHAVSKGNPELIELLISKGADVNAKGQFDRVALHYANKKGMAKILLEHGAIVDAPTNFGETPLHWAAQGVNGFGKQVDIVEFAETLIANGADINMKTGKGRSFAVPLNYAAGSNNLPVAKLLINNGADLGGHSSSLLSSAISLEMAQLLVENGVDVNVPGSNGQYPLHAASSRCNSKIIDFLISSGADPNVKDSNGITPLYFSASSDYCVTSVETLLSHGAEVNAKVRGSALHQAATQGATEVMKVLIANKADVDARDSYGYTPLHTAIQLGGVNKGGRVVAELLLKNGADPNARNTRDHSTPFRQAISRENIELVKLLLLHGAEVSLLTHDYAKKSKEIADFLEPHIKR